MRKERKPKEKSRFFAITYFYQNQVDAFHFLKYYHEDSAIFFIGGFEKTPTTGREHLQAYICLKEPLTENHFRHLNPKVHVEFAVKDPMANDIYCRKMNCFYTFGSLDKAMLSWYTKIDSPTPVDKNPFEGAGVTQPIEITKLSFPMAALSPLPVELINKLI